MGFTSCLLINNDEIDNCTNVSLYDAWCKAETKKFFHGTKANCNDAYQMIWNEHSDVYGLLLVGSLHAKPLITMFDGARTRSIENPNVEFQLLKDLAKKHGYILKKNPSRKESRKTAKKER